MPNLASRVQKWIWIVVYAGMLLFGLGLAVLPRDAGLGWTLTLAGGGLIAIGIVLIWVRSRMKETKETP